MITFIAYLLVTLMLIALFCFGFVIITIIYRLWKYNWSHPLNGFTDWIYKNDNPYLRSRLIKVDTGFGSEWKTTYWFETINGYQLTSSQMYTIYLDNINLKNKIWNKN